ncbi:carbohydrate ABC transporter permease [Prosthecomicrobium sp. N25]|uniref:carbohydrate ABC transporter permease n=1 Tax=Prosthecomicrobium sp. N25 TaxID=3129254 RepID=UPI0030769B7F
MSATASASVPARSGAIEPAGRKPGRISVEMIGVYAVLILAALAIAMPLYVMVVTSMKTMPEIREGALFALPSRANWDAWVKAWTSACTGLTCEGIRVGFWNSVQILIPSVIVSIAVGSINGYALAFWNVPGSKILFGILLLGAFVPYPIFVYPLVRILSTLGLYGSLPGIVLIHTIFGLPVMTVLFRNFYASLPIELFKAARVDGAGFVRLYLKIMLPMSIPILVVAVILQVTGIWNDFLLGLVFAGRENFPMTVQLNNIVNSTQGEREYNVEMAATMLTALVPLAVYFLSGRWFVRGIASGAVKG